MVPNSWTEAEFKQVCTSYIICTLNDQEIRKHLFWWMISNDYILKWFSNVCFFWGNHDFVLAGTLFFGWDDNILADSTINYHHLLVGGIPTPLKNDRVRQLGWLFHSQLMMRKSFKIPWFQSPPISFMIYIFIRSLPSSNMFQPFLVQRFLDRAGNSSLIFSCECDLLVIWHISPTYFQCFPTT